MVPIPSWWNVPFPQKLSARQVHIWAWTLADSHQDWAGDSHFDLLDANERERCGRFRFEHDRAHFAINHANTRRILGSYLGRKPADLSFRVNPFGKPELIPDKHQAPLFFNLSHSRKAALLALSADTEIGVDVEDIAPIEAEVAKDNFSPNEFAALSLLHGDEWLQSFYRCWTRKEAVVKAEGIGLSLPLHSFDVTLLPNVPAELLTVRPPTKFRHPWTLHELSIPLPNMVASLASADPQTSVRCFWLPQALNDL